MTKSILDINLTMKPPISVLTLLTKVFEGSASHNETNLLIEHFCATAVPFVKYRYKGLTEKLLSADLSVKELAVDCVAGLFGRDESDSFSGLKEIFANWQPKIEDESSAQFFVMRLVGKSVDQHISGILRDSDPFFSKILDALYYSSRKNGWVKIRLLGTSYIAPEKQINKLGALADLEYLNQLPDKLFLDLENALTNLFGALEENGYLPAIPLNALARRIKEALVRSASHGESAAPANNMDVNAIVEEALRAALNKLTNSYTNKNKINEYEESAFRLALETVATDMKNGGLETGVHKYFMEQMEFLTIEEFNKKYRNIFEYLFKFFREEVISRLK